MPRFHYFRDALFLTACVAYGINRCFIKPHSLPGFMMFHFNDLWLIPCALPPVLWLHRRLGLRAQEEPPQPGEIAGHLVFWSLLFEWIIPKLTHASGDPADVAAYALGAIIAALWWNRHRWLAATRSGLNTQLTPPHETTFTHRCDACGEYARGHRRRDLARLAAPSRESAGDRRRTRKLCQPALLSRPIFRR